MNILILGPQGSGKGTQAQLLATHFGFYHLEAGKLVREVAKVDPEIDRIVNEKGALIPATRITQIVEADLTKNATGAKGVIFDGFPRVFDQYMEFRTWLSKMGQKIDLAIVLEISEEETIRRLSARRVCEKCGEVYNLITHPSRTENVCDLCGSNLIHREDDKPETITKRLQIYHSETQPMIDEMEKEGLIVRVPGEQPIDVIQNTLVSIVEEKIHAKI